MAAYWTFSIVEAMGNLSYHTGITGESGGDAQNRPIRYIQVDYYI